MAVNIKLACERVNPKVIQVTPEEPHRIVMLGDVITTESGFMRGHGTYLDDEKLHASFAGMFERVNKLVYVKPLKARFNGEGDVVVGRITTLGTKCWKVETNSHLDSILLLSSVNLPGRELRRGVLKIN